MSKKLNKLKIIKRGEKTDLFLNGHKIHFIEKYKLEEDADEAKLTLCVGIDKKIICQAMTDDKKLNKQQWKKQFNSFKSKRKNATYLH